MFVSLWVLLCRVDAFGFPGDVQGTDDFESSFEARSAARKAVQFRRCIRGTSLSTGKGLRNRGFGKRSHFGESLCPCPVFANLVMFQVTVDRLGTRQNIPAPSHPVQAEVHLQKGGEIKVFRQLEIRDLSPGCLLLICILMSLGNALRDFLGC